jgi:hypothetical protein
METFRQKSVRFIAIGHGIDSDYPETMEIAPFINIMSEWYECVKTGITLFLLFSKY